MSEPEEPDVEDIDVPDVPEPETPEEGVIDPDDDYTEGDSRATAAAPLDEPCGLPDDWEGPE
jgi:hypothetical protein